MLRKVCWPLLAFVCIPSAGCGTMGHIVCGPMPALYYGGVQSDAEMLRFIGEEFANSGTREIDVTACVFATGYSLFYLADLPLSAVADTAMLPYVFANNLAWSRQGANQRSEDDIQTSQGPSHSKSERSPADQEPP